MKVVLVFTVACFIQILLFVKTVHNYNDMLESILLTNSINEELKQQLNDEVRNVVYGKTSFESGTQYKTLSLMNQNLDKINIQLDKEQFKDDITRIREAISTSKSYIDQLGEEIKYDVPAAQRNITYEYITISTEIIDERVRQLLQSTLLHSEEVRTNIADNLKSHLIVYSIVYLVILFFSTILIWYTSNEIINPINRLRKSGNKIAKGELTDDSISIDTSSNNEIGRLNHSFKLVYNMLRNTIRNIKTSNASVLQASKDLQLSLSENRLAGEEIANAAQIITTNIENKNQLMKVLMSASNKITNKFYDINNNSLNIQKHLFYLQQLIKESIAEIEAHTKLGIKYSDTLDIIESKSLQFKNTIDKLNENLKKFKALNSNDHELNTQDLEMPQRKKAVTISTQIEDNLLFVNQYTDLIQEKAHKMKRDIVNNNRLDQIKRNFESIYTSNYQMEKDFHHYAQELQSTIKQIDLLRTIIRDLEHYSVSSYSEIEKISGLGEEELTTIEEAEEISNQLIEHIQKLEDNFKQYNV